MAILKKIETEVVLGVGEDNFFKEVEFDFSNIKGIFMVENIDERIDVYDVVPIDCDSVIFSAYIYINVAYKLAGYTGNDTKCNATICGDIKHMTKRIPFGGCIKINRESKEHFNKNDIAKVVNACIEGSHNTLIGPQEIGKFDTPIYNYKKLNDKVCIKIKVKVVRDEIVTIYAEDKECK